MLKNYAYTFLLYQDSFSALKENLKMAANSDDPLAEKSLAKFLSSPTIGHLRIFSQELELKSISRRLETLRNQSSIPTTAKHLLDAIEGIELLIQEELEDKWFLFIKTELLNFVQNPLKSWENGPADAFPSAIEDMKESSVCLALKRPTACVFHLMRVAEKGLHSFARDLNVPMSPNLETENWQNILEQIEKEIKNKFSTMPKGSQKAKDQEFYAGAAVQFAYFKDAWRNHVSHSRSFYNNDQALGVFRVVQDFMNKISERIKE